ncbi:MAG: TonB-dependent receptor [Sphingomonadaceae bacterium]|nr:TonB-dependent receptor [Sphingomonadaceae bacterium]
MASTKIRAYLLGGSLSAAMAMAATPALAQDPPPPEPPVDQIGNAEIVVTAQFREQRLQDTPLSITAVDSELLRSRNQTDIEAIAAQAPSVFLNEMGGAFGDSLGASIRGIGQFDFNPAFEPGVGIYIDDVYYSSLTGASFDLLDVERIEILRGPQGTLTGRNSIGGAIRVISQRPRPELSGYGEIAYGTRDYLSVRAGANFPLTDTLYMRVAGVHKEQDGYVDQVDYGCRYPDRNDNIERTFPAGTGGEDDNCVIRRLGDVDYSGIRTSLLWEPTPDIELMATAYYITSDTNQAAEVLTDINNPVFTGRTGLPGRYFLCGRFCTYASWQLPGQGQAGPYTLDPTKQLDSWGASFHADVDISDSLQLQSITAYRSYDQFFTTDDDFTPLPQIGAQGVNDLDFWFLSQEVRLNGNIGDTIDFTVGGYYSDQRTTYFTQQDIRYIIPGLPLQFTGDDPVNSDVIAAFSTVFWRPITDLTITGGIRYTEESKDYTFHRHNLDGTVPLFPDFYGLGPLEGLTAEASDSRIDWRLSVDYRFAPEVLAYVTVGTGFKGGGVTPRPFIPQHALQGTFGPETVIAYEVGLKTDLFDRRLRLNVAGFYNDYTDIQLPLSDCSAFGGGPCAVVQNAGDGKIYGIEAELQAEPIEGLQIDAALSWLDGEFTSINPAVGAGLNINDPIVSPEWQWSAGIQYRAELGNSGSITPRFDVAYRGEQVRGRGLVPGVLLFYDDYTIANARLTWRNEDEDLSISLEVKNVFDEYYVPLSFDALFGFAGTAYSQVGEPREWALTVRQEF